MRLNSNFERRTGFDALFAAHFRSIWSYVARRVPAGMVDDVVSRCFTIAWQKFAAIPPSPQDRLWLIGVARRCIADQRRSDGRRSRLVSKIALDVPRQCSDADRVEDPRLATVLDSISELSPLDREALQLVLWDGLTHEEASEVMECSVAAFESRYRRARNAVRLSVASESATAQLLNRTTRLAGDES